MADRLALLAAMVFGVLLFGAVAQFACTVQSRRYDECRQHRFSELFCSQWQVR